MIMKDKDLDKILEVVAKNGLKGSSEDINRRVIIQAREDVVKLFSHAISAIEERKELKKTIKQREDEILLMGDTQRELLGRYKKQYNEAISKEIKKNEELKDRGYSQELRTEVYGYLHNGYNDKVPKFEMRNGVMNIFDKYKVSKVDSQLTTLREAVLAVKLPEKKEEKEEHPERNPSYFWSTKGHNQVIDEIKPLLDNLREVASG